VVEHAAGLSRELIHTSSNQGERDCDRESQDQFAPIKSVPANKFMIDAQWAAAATVRCRSCY
jgi:hypothetical protein